MEQSLTFRSSKGEVEIGNRPYLLQTVTGIGGLGADIVEQKGVGQDGTTFIEKTFGTRNITMTILIVADNYDELNERKRHIHNVFSSRDRCEIIYNNSTYTKRCDVVVETSPVLGAEKDKYHQSVFTSLIAHNPFWVDIDASSEIMSISVSNFRFPFEIVEPYEMESEGNNRVIVNNDGDVETPVLISFTGPAVNPIITNETIGQFVRINKALLEGESITINTEFGNKSVIFSDGEVEENAFSLITLDSEFFQLIEGENEIVYSADFGIETAQVNINWRNRFIGV